MINVLENHKRVRVGGVVVTIRQLSPALFIDSKDILPINNIIEAVNSDDKAMDKLEKEQDKIKESIKSLIIKGTVKVNHWFKSKKIEDVIDVLMEKPEIYSYLFVRILNHSLGIKKKVSNLFSLTENLRPLFTD
ncbi:MAG: hypothetical protein GY861_13995 [bacterium]|nr:hypothetical protein [bacterium]